MLAMADPERQPERVNEWVKRPFGSHADDRDGVCYTWIRSYAHSAYGVRRGANVKGTDAARSFWDEHVRFVEALMARSEITIACDPGEPRSIWGWLAAHDDATIHYCFVKRNVVDAGIGTELVMDLLGSRLERAQAYTLEQAELRRLRGIRIPHHWVPDFTFHVRSRDDRAR